MIVIQGPISEEMEALLLGKLKVETLAAKKGIVNWLNEEEAASVLGIPINSKTRTKMAWLKHNGYIQRHTKNGSEVMYWWPELEPVAERISNCEIIIPTKY